VRRELDWQACVNVRDLGGLRARGGTLTRFGAVIRSDTVASLTDRGWRELQEYGVTTIVDLRSPDEVAADRPLRAGSDWLVDDMPDADPTSRPVPTVNVPVLGAWTSELEAHFEHNGQWFFGYLDAMTIEAPHSIEEWKYAATQYNKLRIARQAAVYLNAFPQADRFVLWVFVKSQLRPRKIETMSEFEERVFDDFVKKGRGKVYNKTMVPRADIDVKSILDQMTSRYQLLPILEKLEYPPSYKSCMDCREYRSLCEKKVGANTQDIIDSFEGEKKWEESMKKEIQPNG